MFRRLNPAQRVLRRSRRLTPTLDRLEGRALLATVPTTTAAIFGQAGANGYYTGPVTIALTATEPNVPPTALTTLYRVNDGPFTAGNQVVLTGNGTDVVQFFSTDTGGNAEVPKAIAIKIDSTPPILTATAQPTTLWPPNHKFQTVTVGGTALDPDSGLNGSTVFYSVRDEYGLVQPQGSAMVNPDGTYSFHVSLQASRTGQDRDGRQYTILVTTQSAAGLATGQTVIVTVPHDQGHSVGGGPRPHGGGHPGRGNPGHGHGRNEHQAPRPGKGHGHDHGHGHGQGRNQGPGRGQGNGHGHGRGHD